MNQNAQGQSPLNLDGPCPPDFKSKAVRGIYGRGLMERPAADVFDVLHYTGFVRGKVMNKLIFAWQAMVNRLIRTLTVPSKGSNR